MNEEKQNFIRLFHLVNSIGSEAARVHFDIIFPPNSLIATLNNGKSNINKLYSKRILAQSQKDILFPLPPDINSSKSYDITLMVCLLRNLSNATKPTNGFDQLPPHTEIFPAADFARLKHYRNKLVHSSSDEIENTYYKTSWKDITEAIYILGGQVFISRCEELDGSEMTKTSKAEEERLREELQCLKEEITNDKKVETCALVEALEKENTFIPTRTLDVGLKFLKKKGVVLMTGMAGIGKTRNCLKLLNIFCSEIEHEYQMIKLENLSEWDEFVDLDKHYIVFIDDIFGKTNANYDKGIHEKIINQVYSFVQKGNIKVILSTRDTVKRQCQEIIESHRLFQGSEIDLNSEPFQMNVDQKCGLLVTYMKRNDDFEYTSDGFADTTGAIILNTSDIHDIALSNLVIGFPQAVQMFVNNKKYISLGSAFFRRPDEQTLEDINDMRRQGHQNHKLKIQYSLLVLTVLNDNCFAPYHAHAIVEVNDIIHTIYGDSIKITKDDLIDSVHTLQGRFFQKHPHIAMFEHRLLFESVLLSFG
ncbi:unnamed protein product [Mytilus coruscus]|uniref:Uncharacterized protein n=1 Tax=Mytilus coruscus TaxID=42192 RepID=A0A6J8CY99_MYTCO|nr:unnamed protein product [Mytilus coruscus]